MGPHAGTDGNSVGREADRRTVMERRWREFAAFAGQAATATNATSATNATNAANAGNANTVGGFPPSGLIRAAGATTNDLPDANGPALSTTINAPTSGHLLVWGNVDADGAPLDTYECNLAVDNVGMTGALIRSRVNDEGGFHTDNGEENCATHSVQQVAAGAHTISVNILDRTTATFSRGALSVLFVPFGPTGSNP